MDLVVHNKRLLFNWIRHHRYPNRVHCHHLPMILFLCMTVTLVSVAAIVSANWRRWESMRSLIGRNVRVCLFDELDVLQITPHAGARFSAEHSNATI